MSAVATSLSSKLGSGSVTSGVAAATEVTEAPRAALSLPPPPVVSSFPKTESLNLQKSPTVKGQGHPTEMGREICVGASNCNPGILNDDASASDCDSDSTAFEDLVCFKVEKDGSHNCKISKSPLDGLALSAASSSQKKIEDAMKFVPIGVLTSSETIRQNYHRYLRKSGLLGAISKSILALYDCDELPSEVGAVSFMANTLGFSMNAGLDLEGMKAYNETLKVRIEKLDATNDELRRRVDMYESTETPIDSDPELYDPLSDTFPAPKVQLRKRHHKKKVFLPFKSYQTLKAKMKKPLLPEGCSNNDQSNFDLQKWNKPFDYPYVVRDETICEIYHGTKIRDPYRWLEETRSDKVFKFIQDQNQRTLNYLETCPKRDLVRKRLTELLNYERYSSPFKAGPKYYYFKNSGLQNQSVLYVQDSLDHDGHGTARVFFDPNALSKDGTVAIADYKFSENGEIFAYGLSESGSDWITIYFKCVLTGEDYPEKLTRVKYSNISWTHNNRGIFYACYPVQSGNTDGSETTRALNQKIYFHRIGTSQVDDILVVDFPDHPTWLIDAQVTDCGMYLIINVSEEISKESLYYAEIENEIREKFLIHPIVTNFDAKYSYITNEEEIFYFVTSLNSPNNRIISLDILNPAEYLWKTIVPENLRYPLDWANCVAGDIVVACYIEDVKNTLTLFKLSDGSVIQKLRLEAGTVTEFSGVKKSHEIFFQFSSFLTRGRIYYVDLSQPEITVSVFKESVMKGVDSLKYVTSQIFYPSKDGTNIPMFIVHRKDLELNGDQICLLYGYGGFGISVTPGFYSSFMVIMQNMNGVIAVANIRGGGEYGEIWHKAGILNNKQNSFDDFQAAAEYLIKKKYTNPSKLIIKGASNGGLLVAACANQRPELFGAAIAQVGVMDLLRFDKFTIGHAWCSDFGKPSHESDFENLLRISPLHNVHPPEAEDVQYPAVLLFTADHDDRVVPLHSYKFVAELQFKIGKLRKQTRPLMLRVDTDAGHGAHMPISKWIEEETDMLSFVMNALDVKFSFTAHSELKAISAITSAASLVLVQKVKRA